MCDDTFMCPIRLIMVILHSFMSAFVLESTTLKKIETKMQCTTIFIHGMEMYVLTLFSNHQPWSWSWPHHTSLPHQYSVFSTNEAQTTTFVLFLIYACLCQKISPFTFPVSLFSQRERGNSQDWNWMPENFIVIISPCNMYEITHVGRVIKCW